MIHWAALPFRCSICGCNVPADHEPEGYACAVLARERSIKAGQ